MFKKYLKQNKRLYAILKILFARNNELAARIIDDVPNQFNVQINSLGKENKNDIIYLIRRTDEYEGFFALLRTSLYYLAFADRFNFTPYILWSEKCAYYEKDGYEGRKNPYEYYFKQPVNITLESVMNSYNVIYSKTQDVKVLNRFSLELPYYYDNKFVEIMGELAKKYIHFQDSIEEKINMDINPILNEGKILGIHYRGTDFRKNYDAHPKFILPNDYFNEIDNALSEYGYNKIFVATDDKDALYTFINKYGNKVIYYKDTLRGKGNISVMNKKDERSQNNFLKGYEVLRDAYTLSRMDGIISGVSMVSIFSRIFKKQLEQKYKLDIFIDKGINENNNKYISCR